MQDDAEMVSGDKERMRPSAVAPTRDAEEDRDNVAEFVLCGLGKSVRDAAVAADRLPSIKHSRRGPLADPEEGAQPRAVTAIGNTMLFGFG